MKRVLPHPERESRPNLWRSLDELASSPDFVEKLEREFPQGASEWHGAEISRRNFLQLMGGSMALAGIGLTGCRRPEAYLVPFTNGVEWTIPGKFLYYATSMPRRNGAMPLIATTSDGRPTKLEGNPLHPISNGATDTFAQASILDLYDPNRSKEIKSAGAKTDVAALGAKLDEIAAAAAAANGGAGLAFLVERNASPTRDRLLAQLRQKYPNLIWAEHEPLGANETDAAVAACFGANVAVVPDFSRADKVLAVDSDFLNASFSGLDQVRGFMARRRISEPGQPMNRLYAAETHYSSTGGMADHRVRIKPSEVGTFLRALGEQIASLTGDGNLSSVVAAFPSAPLSADLQWITECAKDLAASRGKSLLVVGDQQPAAVQALGFAINNALGALGQTLHGQRIEAPQAASIAELAAAMQAGRVQNLFILGGNPVYNAPADLRFGELLSGVPLSVRLGLYEDETSAACTWHVPQAHYLESWGDTRSADGTVCAVQPMILPLWDGMSELEILNRLAGNEQPIGPQLVRETFAQIAGGGDLEAKWTEFLRQGFLPDTAWADAALAFNAGNAAALAGQYRPETGGLEIAFIPSSTLDDGRYANNGWLQETPDFATKITWDNAALISPATAKELGVATGDMVSLSAGDRSMEAAALIAPGHADGALSIALGYGRLNITHVSDKVGFNAYPLRTTRGRSYAANASLKRTGAKHKFAETQTHQNMEGRDLVREATMERYAKEPTFAQTMGMDGHIPPNISLFTHPPLTSPEQWGMTVDLSTCTGCNACVVACQAENNVPIVGKDQVSRGRNMAWIRMDRYFAGDENDPEMLSQAIMCQHCENAPCETVCPVNATVHSEDGLNLMAYNRCIGTRYCANNCPWKVRRFNFFDYNQRPLDQLYLGPFAKKGMADSLQMSKNPNVTVRMRGVMEKCTYCIQRIEEARITQTVRAGASDKSKVPFPEVKSACQQACPSESIVFGNISDSNSRVAKLKKEPRNYEMLKYLNVSPRTTYLARIKNPNMAMPGADKVGWANGHPHHGDHGDGHNGYGAGKAKEAQAH